MIKNSDNIFDLCIVGGGASGFFAAATLIHKMPNAKIIILEQSTAVLQKVKISGGGRCNVTNSITEPSEFALQYPRGTKQMRQQLYGLSNLDVVEFFETRNVRMKTEADGRIFPMSDNSQSIIDCLMGATLDKGVQLKLRTKLLSVSKDEETYSCLTDEGEILAKHVLLATGGVQNGKMPKHLPNDAKDWIETVPSLFTFKVADFSLVEMAGISFPNAKVEALFSGKTYGSEGPLLITHWGFSGPCILKLSSKLAFDAHAFNYHFPFRINYLGMEASAVDAMLLELVAKDGKSQVKNKHSFDLSKRFWAYVIEVSGIKPEDRWSDINKNQRKELLQNLTAMPFSAAGKSMFKEEFVAAGGIDLKVLKAKSYEHKQWDNIYFSGEILNVDGFTGGFNFQNAWCSGYAVAMDIAKKLC